MPADPPEPRAESDAELPDQTEFGKVTWHSSEEDGGPDVGMMLGLGDGQAMWVGEITRRAHEDGGEAVAALGDDGGWWIAMFPDHRAMAKFADTEAAHEFFERLSGAIRTIEAARYATIRDLRAEVERLRGALHSLAEECKAVIGRLTIHSDDESRVIEARNKLGAAIHAGLKDAMAVTKVANAILDLLPPEVITKELHSKIIVTLAPHVRALPAPPSPESADEKV